MKYVIHHKDNNNQMDNETKTRLKRHKTQLTKGEENTIKETQDTIAEGTLEPWNFVTLEQFNWNLEFGIWNP